MNDARMQRPGNPAFLWASAILFGLFAVQASYQIYQVHRNHLETDADRSAELANAVFLEEEPASDTSGWPQWRGPQRDGAIHMDGLATDWPQHGPTLLWQRPIGLGYSSFAVKDGRLYSLFQQGNQEVVACWRVADGEELWRYEYDCHSDVKDYPGPRSTPTLDDDRLYTVGSDGTLLCLDAATGSLHWRKDLLEMFHAAPPHWGVAFSPLIDGDLLFTCPGGPNGNSLAAFHKITGDLVWKRFDEPAGYSSPVAVTIDGTRQILFFMGKSLLAVRARDGRLCWRYPWATSYDVNAATPLFFQARRGLRSHAERGNEMCYVFISSGYGRGCALLKIAPSPLTLPSPPKGGEEKNKVPSPPKGGEGRVRGDGGFEAQTVYTGKQMCSHFASPVRCDEYLYGIDDSRLTCLNLRTGKVRWRRPGCNKGSLLRVNDELLVLGEEGKLWLLDASPTKPAPWAEARPFSRSRCWTMPVLAEGKLFLRDERQMKCFAVKKSKTRDEEQPRVR